MTFHDAQWFYAVAAVVPLVLLVFRVGRRLHARRLHAFIAARLRDVLVRSDNRGREMAKVSLLLAAMIFIVAALANPMLNETEEAVKREGVDFMIALDASNSMLVRDAAPDHNRLEAAKRAIRDLMATFNGDRVGLIAFAADARMLTPLTHNYATLDLVLDGIDTETIWRQGTDISRAIEVAAANLKKKEIDSRVLVIISDGGNLRGDPLMAARQAKVRDKLTIFTIGLGTIQGGKIPIEERDKGGNVISTEYIKDINDEEVVCGLDERTLQGIAQVTGGRYVRLAARDIDSQEPSAFAQLYETDIKPLATRLRTDKIVAGKKVFQVPLGAAVLLLLIEMMILRRAGRRRPAPAEQPQARAPSHPVRTAAILLAALLCCGATAPRAEAQESRQRRQSTLHIPHMAHRVAVDGEMREWKSIAPMPLPFMKKDTSSVRLAWREDGLYGAMHVERDGTVKLDTQQLWRGDCLEVFIEKDNKLDPEATDNDHEVEQYVFAPDVPEGTGLGFWTIPYGAHKSEKTMPSKKHVPGSSQIACAYKRYPGRYVMEFYIPAAMLAPAEMIARTRITLHFSVRNDGWAVQNFAVDGTVNSAYRRPITWRTVYLKPPAGEEPPAEEPEDTPTAAADGPEVPADTPAGTEPAPPDPEERDAAIARARDLMKQGDAGAARELLREQLLDWPDNPYLLYNYGITAYAQRDFVIAESSWTKALVFGDKRLRPKATFQLGNVTFRQAYALKSTRRSWDNALMLYRRAEEYYGELTESEQTPLLQERARKNLRAALDQIVHIHLTRAQLHLKEALKLRETLGTQTDAKSWQIIEWTDQLVKEGEKAKVDFDSLLEINPDHKEARRDAAVLDELLEFGLLAKARAVRKEVDEAGSTQNQVWTLGKYQDAISYYDQVLDMNPENAAAKVERRQIQEATRDVCMKEANIEREMARRILREAEDERKLLKRIEELTGKPGREAMRDLAAAEASLRWLRTRYPPEDPEEAIKHWHNAIEDYDTGLIFTPGDRMVLKEKAEVTDTIYEFRKTLAEQYLQQTTEMPMTNDEEADAVVWKLENAVGHLLQAQEMRPTDADKLVPKLEHAKSKLARAYKDRGDIYVKLGQMRRKTHLDRAVAYMEKARQDYVFAYKTDRELAAAQKAHQDMNAQLIAMRLELSKAIAAKYREEAESGEAGAEPDPEIDLAKLRDLALQEHDDSSDLSRGYETQERPQPIDNW